MEYTTFLKRLASGNYRHKKAALKYLPQYFKQDITVQKEILEHLLVQRAFLMPECWTAIADLDVLHVDPAVHQAIIECSVFYRHGKCLNEQVAALEQSLFENSGLPLSAASLFLAFGKSVEIGDTNLYHEFHRIRSQDGCNLLKTRFLRPYDFHSLLCLERIIRRNQAKLKTEDQVIDDLPYQILHTLDRLIYIEKEIDMMDGMMDAWIYGGLQMHIVPEGQQIKQVLLRPVDDSELNRVRAHLAKTHYRQLHYEQRSSEIVSEDPHFKKVDQKFRTHEGMVGMFTSNMTATEQTEGLIAIDGGDMFEGTDEERHSKFIRGILESNFHYKYRRFREKSTFPADVEDLRETMIALPNARQISLETVFKVMDVIAALSDTFRHLAGQKMLNLKLAIISEGLQNQQIAQLTPLVLEDCDIALAQHFNLMTEVYHCILTTRGLVAWIAKVSHLPHEQIFSALRLIAVSPKNESGLQVMLFQQNKVYWQWRPFVERSLSRYLYDRYLMEKVYVEQNQHKKRASAYETSLACYFKTAGFQARPNCDYGANNAELDLLAVKEGYGFVIEIKLSNKHREKFGDQNSWRVHNLDGKAPDQIKRAMDFFATRDGHAWIKENLHLPPDMQELKLIPLIVTDHFFYDHQHIAYDEGTNQSVRVISFFELYLLLNNLPLLNPDHKPEFSMQAIRLGGNIIPQPAVIEFDSSGEETVMVHADGRVEKKERAPEPPKTEDKQRDARKYRKWWDRKDGISPGHLLELIEKSEVWSFLPEELEGFQNRVGLSSFQTEFRYDI